MILKSLGVEHKFIQGSISFHVQYVHHLWVAHVKSGVKLLPNTM